jgi:ABC-type nickel/cobalt efflux system permease component RcnA
VIAIPQPKPVAMPAMPPPSSTPQVAQPRGTVVKGDYLSRLLAKDKIGWQWLLLGVLVAFGIGGAHALEPGHGKTIVAAYLVGSRGTMKHAAILGGVVTFTHTISVFLLGLATLLLSKTVVPEHVIRVMEAISGMSIVAIGAVMLVQRLRRLHSGGHSHGHSHHHDGHAAGQAHASDHAHDHSHDHGHAHHHGHEDDHGRSHGAGHSHGHSHVPEGEITFASLIGLGVSGGLVPCPAALVLMLAAIAFGHPGAGLLLLVSFSLGLAGVLMAVGMVVLYAKSWLPDPGSSSQHPLFRLVPVLSAIIILCLGLLMTGVSLGWVRPGLSV